MTDDSQWKVEHLKLIQGVVTRMAGNSAQMKTWTVTLVTAAFVFSGASDDPHWLIAAGGCIAVIAFWAMDAKYLHLERCYVNLYDAVVAGESVTPFNLDYRPFVATVDSVWKIAWSWSVRWFYVSLLALTMALVTFLSI